MLLCIAKKNKNKIKNKEETLKVFQDIARSQQTDTIHETAV